MSSCSFSRKTFHVRHPAVVDVGCNCRPKFKFSSFTSLFSSSSSSSNSSSRYSKAKSMATSSSATNITATSSSWDPMATTTSHYEESTPSPPLLPQPDEVTRSAARRRRRRRKKKASAADGEEGRVARESVAVVKETTDPYVAFKDSMVQMIVEKEIYGWDDLNDLLRRFLSLNSPRHHHHILRAFADLWDGTEAAAATSSSSYCVDAVQDHNYAPAAGASSPSPYGYYNYYY